jgi:lactoylglutathione lyase
MRITVFLAGIALTAGLSGAALAAEPQTRISVLVAVADLDKSVDYYTRLVGLKVAARVPLGGGNYEVLLSRSGTDTDSTIGLIGGAPRTEPVTHGSGYNRLAVFVATADEVDSRTKAIQAAGYKVVIPPSTAEMPGGRTYRYSHFKDPDGYTVEFTWFDPKVMNPQK